MKTSVKHFLRVVLLLIVLGTGNLLYYVFARQKVSSEKLQKGEELSIYECLSVYQMHMAIWSLGWPLAPQAARECFMLHFPVKKDTVKVYGKIDSPKIRSAIASLKYEGQSVRVAWDGNEAYALHSPEHMAAIAVNPCNVTRGKNLSDDGSSYEVAITSSMQYPKWSSTSFDLGGVTIHVQEGLFRYLQDRGWLSCFVASYSSRMTL